MSERVSVQHVSTRSGEDQIIITSDNDRTVVWQHAFTIEGAQSLRRALGVALLLDPMLVAPTVGAPDEDVATLAAIVKGAIEAAFEDEGFIEDWQEITHLACGHDVLVSDESLAAFDRTGAALKALATEHAAAAVAFELKAR